MSEKDKVRVYFRVARTKNKKYIVRASTNKNNTSIDVTKNYKLEKALHTVFFSIDLDLCMIDFNDDKVLHEIMIRNARHTIDVREASK